MNSALLKTINSICGGGIGYGLPPQELFSTGLPQLDTAIGGIPRGRIVDIYGTEGSGKTTLALHLAQKLPGPMLYIDADHGLSPHMLGCASGYLLDAGATGSMEKVLDACRIAAGSGAFGSIVIDTVAALPTKQDLRLRFTDADNLTDRERQAKVMATALPMLAGALCKTGCTLFLVNQIRDKPGVMYGCPENPTGGKALRYYAALRLRVSRYESIQKQTFRYNTIQPHVMGQKLKIRVVKCKYGPPGRETEVPLLYGEGLAESPPPLPRRVYT